MRSLINKRHEKYSIVVVMIVPKISVAIMFSAQMTVYCPLREDFRCNGANDKRVSTQRLWRKMTFNETL